MNVHGTVTWNRSSSCNSRCYCRHLVMLSMRMRMRMGWYYFFRRTTPTATISSAISRHDITASFTSGCACSIRPVALPGLCLIEYLWHHKLSFFLFFMLPKMVLVHHPIRLFGFSIFPKVGVEDQDFLAPFLFAIHHDWPGLACLVPPCFPTLQVTFGLDFSSFSCPSCVSFRRSVEEVPAQAISCDSCCKK